MRTMNGSQAKHAIGRAVALTVALQALATGGTVMARNVEIPGTAHPAVLCRDADGRLTIAAGGSETRPEGCRTISLPVPPGSVRWAGALPQAKPPGRDRLVLSGTGQAAGFVPAGVSFEEPPGPAARPATLPLDRPLIPALSARTFGVEERAVLSRTDESVTLRCGAGDKPAGLVLDPGPARLPAGAEFALHGHVTGDAGFFGALAGPGRDGRAVGLPTDGTFDQIPTAEEAAHSSWFVLACPPTAGTLTLLDLRLASRTQNPGAVQVRRSAWAWRPRRWREAPEGLVAEALALGAERLFVSVEIEDGALADEARFSEFVGLARASGIGVAVVEGDPGMALDAGRAVAIRRLGALVAYQRRAAGDRRLAGVQYDIEPYLLPGFQAEPEHILRGWASTLDGLSANAAGLDLDLVLPFWLPLHGSAGLVLPTIGRVAERVTVMAYRTTPADILTAAQPLLDWSASAARPLHVAVEAGPVGDETARAYRPAPTGDLLLVPQAGGDALVLLLAAPVTLSASDRLYALERESVVPGARVSFLGDRRRLDEVIAQILPTLSAWPSFSGLALHGLID